MSLPFSYLQIVPVLQGQFQKLSLPRGTRRELPPPPSVGLPQRQERKTDRAVRVRSGPWDPHLMLFQAASESTGLGLGGHQSSTPHPPPRCPPEKEDSSLLGSPQQRGCQFSLKSSLSHPPCTGSPILPSSR